MPEPAPSPARASIDPHQADGALSAWTDALLLGVAALYAAFVTLLTLVRGVPITPDVVAMGGLLAFVMVARRRWPALRDWTAFLVLFLAYELMRGLADDVGMPVHIGDIAALERSLFGGHLPTAALQGLLHPTSGTDWLAVAGTAVYYFHFALPILTAWVLWRLRPMLFHPYLVSLILLAISVMIFGLLRLMPGDPIDAYIPPDFPVPSPG